MKICSAESCGKKSRSRGMCATHYSAWLSVAEGRPACGIEECDTPSRARGLCDRHYQNWRRVQGGAGTCSEVSCEKGVQAKGLCSTHYQRQRNHGDTSVVLKRVTLAELGQVPHGTPQGYNFHKCRCDECLAWQRPYAREMMYRKYGINTEVYERMLADQGGVCAICQRPEPGGKNLHVDHCHSTGRVRALLCRACNTSIGQMQDDPDRLMAAAAYLLQFTDVLEEAR